MPEPWCRNLHHSFEELVAHLHELAPRAASRGDGDRAGTWDVYLTVCALWQVVEDFRHRGFLALQASLEAGALRPRKLDRYLEVLPSWVAPVVRRAVGSGVLRVAARSADGMAGARVRLREAVRERDLRVVADTLRDGAATLADAWARPDAGAHGDDATRVIGRILTVLEGAQVPREIAPRILKIPSCFHDFDCHPDDCRELVRRFAENAPDRGRPLTVVGIRTSGSYLAPLCVAFLRQFGFTDVELASVRPKCRSFDERSHLRRRAERGAFRIVDDPPVAVEPGSRGADTAAVGVPAARLVSDLLQFRSRFAGPSLDTAPAVVLPDTECASRLFAAPLPGSSFEGRTPQCPRQGACTAIGCSAVTSCAAGGDGGTARQLRQRHGRRCSSARARDRERVARARAGGQVVAEGLPSPAGSKASRRSAGGI
jgi:hypothetical protein